VIFQDLPGPGILKKKFITFHDFPGGVRTLANVYAKFNYNQLHVVKLYKSDNENEHKYHFLHYYVRRI